MEEPNNVTTTEESSEAVYPNTARRSHSAGDVLVEEKTGHKVAEMSSKTDDAVTSVLKHNDIIGNASTKKKVCITDFSTITNFYILCLSLSFVN